jgi:hypothetical protein
METKESDQDLIKRFQAALADPATPVAERDELREELGIIATSYVMANLLSDDDDSITCATISSPGPC